MPDEIEEFPSETEEVSLDDPMTSTSRHSFRRGAMVTNASMPINVFGQTVLGDKSINLISPENLEMAIDSEGVAKVSASIFDSPAMRKFADQLLILETPAHTESDYGSMSVAMQKPKTLNDFECMADAISRKITPLPVCATPARFKRAIGVNLPNICMNDACGVELPSGARFCPDCGMAQLAKFCIHCGAKFGEAMKFCPECGAQR